MKVMNIVRNLILFVQNKMLNENIEKSMGIRAHFKNYLNFWESSQVIKIMVIIGIN